MSLDDLFHASKDMIWHGELTEAEAAMIRPLDELLTQLIDEVSDFVFAAAWDRQEYST